MRCPISLIPLDELEHPVVFRNQKALVVYEAEHLLRWLRIKRRNPVTNERLSPLAALLRPHRLPHTTDAQLAQTHRLLGYANTRRYLILDAVATPLLMCVSVLLAVAIVTIASEALLRARPNGRWLLGEYRQAIVDVNALYARFVHPCVAVVVRTYFGSDVVVRCWCAALVAVDASSLMVHHHNATGVTGLDVLLGLCR